MCFNNAALFPEVDVTVRSVKTNRQVGLRHRTWKITVKCVYLYWIDIYTMQKWNSPPGGSRKEGNPFIQHLQAIHS